MRLVEIGGDAGEHQRDDGNRHDEDELLAEGQPAQADGQDHRSERDTAAENAPIDRLQRDGIEPDQHGAGEGNGRDGEPEQEHRLIAVDLREPAGQTGHRQDAGPQREPSQHLHQAKLAVDLGLWLWRAVGALPVDHLGGHGVGDDVLQHHADHDHELRHDIERVLAGESDPAAGRAGQQDHARGHQARADEHIGPALRAQDRHRIGELPEHHLDGPGQVSHTAMAASSAGVKVSASLIQKAWAMATSPSAP